MRVFSKASLYLFFVGTFFALLLRVFIWEDFRVVSRSMEPTLHSGDLLFVSKVSYGLRLPFSEMFVMTFDGPSPGDVVVFSLPDDRAQTLVKRVVAVAGDRVEILGGRLTINGNQSQYRDSDEANRWWENLPSGSPHFVYLSPHDKQSFGPVIVPKNHLFVLGDNRSESSDSRAWGPIPIGSVKGRGKIAWQLLGIPNDKSRIRKIVSLW